MLYHIIGCSAGFLLDLLVGDPYWMPHPIRLIGRLISFLESKLNRPGTKGNRFRGVLTVCIVCSLSMAVSALILLLSYHLHPVAGICVEAILTSYCLAAKCLKVESMKVYQALKNGTIEDARYAVSMIVGRDTENLTEAQVARAAVETVAENTSDGEIGPLVFLALGGPILGYLYKSVNTMDSMIGYKTERYEDFGRCAARLDDVVNFIPARISALVMIVSCCFLGKDFDAAGAWRIFRRDRYNHASPNSAQTESACAGALGLQLAGPASYGGIIEDKLYIGDPVRSIETEDIRRANRLMYATSIMCSVLAVLILSLVNCFGRGW